MRGWLAVGDDEDLLVGGAAFCEGLARQAQPVVEVGEVQVCFAGAVEGDADADFPVAGGDGFGHHEGDVLLAEMLGGGCEADVVDGVIREAAIDEGLHSEGDALGGDVAAVAHHGSGEVDEDGGGGVGARFGVVDLEIGVAEPEGEEVGGGDLLAGALLLDDVSGDGVSERLEHGDFADGVAELVGARSFGALAAVSGEGRFVAFLHAGLEFTEDLEQRAVLHASDHARGHAESAFGVVFDEASVLKVLDELLNLLVGVLREGVEAFLAVFDDEVDEAGGREEVVG